MILSPMLSSRVQREGGVLDRPVWRVVERTLSAIESGYRRLLPVLLDHTALTLLGAGALRVATAKLARTMEFSFMPSQDVSAAKVIVELPAGSRLEDTGRQLADLTAQIERIPGVVNTYSKAGGGVQEEVHKGEILVNLVPIRERGYSPEQLKRHLRNQLRAIPGTRVAVVDGSSAIAGRPQPIQFNLRGASWDELLQAAEKLADRRMAFCWSSSPTSIASRGAGSTTRCWRPDRSVSARS